MKQTAVELLKVGTKEFNDSAMEMFGGKPKQQTSVEWLESNLPTAFKDLTINKQLIEQAKEMEKQQIVEARVKKPLQSEWDEAEQYYNETFKNK